VAERLPKSTEIGQSDLVPVEQKHPELAIIECDAHCERYVEASMANGLQVVGVEARLDLNNWR